MFGDLIYPDVDVLLSLGCYPQGRSHFFATDAPRSVITRWSGTVAEAT